jgi:hypothetical protein
MVDTMGRETVVLANQGQGESTELHLRGTPTTLRPLDHWLDDSRRSNRCCVEEGVQQETTGAAGEP